MNNTPTHVIFSRIQGQYYNNIVILILDMTTNTFRSIILSAFNSKPMYITAYSKCFLEKLDKKLYNIQACSGSTEKYLVFLLDIIISCDQSKMKDLICLLTFTRFSIINYKTFAFKSVEYVRIF